MRNNAAYLPENPIVYIIFPESIHNRASFSIFEPLETTEVLDYVKSGMLWFAFKLVSLNHWKQPQTLKQPKP